VAEACAALLALPYRTHVALQLHRLDDVVQPPAAAGEMREANATDFDLLCTWQLAFLREANVREGADEIAKHVRRRIEIGGAWLWEAHGEPVSHAGCRPTPIRSARIAPVYTPREFRGRGYASALVAALSRRLLALGRAPLYLFADAANPTAGSLYRRIGFRYVGDHVHLMRVEA
jgi:predicted GNAT family acetyltransferase